MAFGDTRRGRQSSGRSGGFGRRGQADPNTIEGLAETGRKAGLDKQVDEIVNAKLKLGFLGRLSRGLGADNPAEAILTAREKGIPRGLIEYPAGVIRGVSSAVTGTDYDSGRRTFKDVAEGAGIDNTIAKYGIGFLGDVFLAPSTYFGGAIARGLVSGAKGTTNVSLKGVGKISPKAEQGVRLVGEGLKDAVGEAINPLYKASAGLVERVVGLQRNLSKAKIGLVKSNLARLGTGALSPSQQDELVAKLLAGKRAEFFARESSEGILKASEQFIPVRNKIDRLIETREGWVGKVEKEINRLEKTGLKTALKTKANEGPEALVSAIKEKTTDDVVNFDANDVPTGFGKPGERKLSDIFAKTTARGANSTKAFVEVLIAEPNGTIQALKRQVATKENKLGEFFDEIEKLKGEYDTVLSKEGAMVKLADTTRAGGKTVARERAQSADPVVQKTIEAQATRSQKFAKALGVEDPYEVYFPSLRDESVQKFFRDENVQRLGVGTRGYMKEFRNILNDKELIRNPAQAFATREFEGVKDLMMADQLRAIVKDFGKPLTAFKTEDDARRAGYAALKEKGMFGKPLGYISQADQQAIDHLITPKYLMIDTLAKYSGFDMVTALFKRSVTGLFLPFHVRNYASGIIQNYEVLGVDALNPKTISAGQKLAWQLAKGMTKFPSQVVETGGKEIDMGKAFGAFAKRFGGDTDYIRDIADATTGGGVISESLLSKDGLLSLKGLKYTTKEVGKGIVKTATPSGGFGLGQEAIHFRVARGIGAFVETQQKATAFIAALGQGKNIDEALDLAIKSGFDYRMLTQFEGKILRRIVPFYSFIRKNAELQLRTLGANPERINHVLNAFENIGQDFTADEKEALPPFLEEMLGRKLEDSPEGLKRYVASFGTPVEAFADLFNRNPTLKAISLTNPLLKVPIEYNIGKDSFRQRDVKEVYDAREYSKAPQFIKDLLEIKEVQKPILKKNSRGDLVKVGERTQYVADPEKLLIARTLFTSRGFSYLDQVFNGDIEGFAKFVNITTGVKVRELDLEQQRSFRESETERELEDVLKRYGEVATFRRNFIPEDD